MIKTYEQFINEDVSKMDAHKYLLKGALKNIENRFADENFAKVGTTEGSTYVEVSGEDGEAMENLNTVTTYLVLPGNFKPNLLIGIESGSRKPSDIITKFQTVSDNALCELAKQLYDAAKGHQELANAGNIYFYVRH